MHENNMKYVVTSGDAYKQTLNGQRQGRELTLLTNRWPWMHNVPNEEGGEKDTVQL